MMIDELERRFGYVRITDRVLVELEPEHFSSVLFEDCIILECKFCFMTGIFEYKFFCPDFDIVPIHTIIPEYVAVLRTYRDDEENITEITRQWDKCEQTEMKICDIINHGKAGQR